MKKRILSILLAGLMCLSLFPLSAAAVAVGETLTATYASGIVNVHGTGFTSGTSYTVRVIDTVRSSIIAMGQVTANGSGQIDVFITTGALGTLTDCKAYVNNPAGALAASADLIRLTATIRAGTGGKITTGTSGDYFAGNTINLAATADSGYIFSNWTSAGGGIFGDPNSPSTTFTMPGNSVVITANFTAAGDGGGTPIGGGGGPTGGGTTPGGGGVVTPPGGNTGATTPSGNGTETTEPSGNSTEANTPSGNNTETTPGGNSGNPSDSVKETQKGDTYTVSTELKAATAAAGTAQAEVDGTTVTELVDRAKKAESSGHKAVVEIRIKPETGTKSLTLEIPTDSFKELAATTNANVKVDAGIGTISFNSKALSSIGEAASGTSISISIKAVSTGSLSPEAQAKVGDRPVYDFSIISGGKKITDFGGGTAEISLPYIPKQGEDLNSIVVYYIDGNGELKPVIGKYNSETGTVDFKTSHFSKYAVGYNEVHFKDVAASDWYSKAVTFLAARGIVSSTTGKFEPKYNITRADFLVMVMRAYCIEPDTKITDNFKDAGSKYYTPYLGAAKRLGLVTGTDGKFLPEASISRQDMYVILYRVLKQLNELPSGAKVKSFESFKDSGSVAAYAKDAMKLFAETGIITGDGANLNPKGTSTRAQTAQTLYNLLSK